MASKKKPKSKDKLVRAADALHAAATVDTSIADLHDFFGLAVPSRGSFTVEAWLIGDTPQWSVDLTGRTRAGQPLRRSIAESQPHASVTVSGVPDGDYFLSIVVTLQAPGAQFKLAASSSIDDDKVDLSVLPGNPLRSEMRPVKVG